jgi:hypothetical protein
MKECIECNTLKSLEDYPKRKSSKDGTRNQCIVCHKLKIKASSRKRYLDNKDFYVQKGIAYRKNNPEYHNKYNKLHYIKNKERLNKQTTEWAKNNKTTIKAIQARYYQNNITKLRLVSKIKQRYQYKTNRDVLLKRMSEWSKNNLDKKAMHNNKRRADKLNATPDWSEKDKISIVYKKARELGRLLGCSMEVDHCIPLNNPDVCGLHVWYNLQILEKSINCSKSNKFSL